MIFIIYTFIIAASAYAIVEILMQPNMILNWYYEFLYDLSHRNVPTWILKPIGLCGVCFAGQCGFWLYFYFKTEYDIINHILFALLTIFFYSKILRL